MLFGGNKNHQYVTIRNVIREAKLANTLFLITGASVFTLLPFQILNLLVYLQITANLSHLQPTVLVIRVLQYSNSFVNVIIYPLRIPEFKNCLLHLLRCCVVPHQIFRAGVLPSAESRSVVSLVRFTSTQHLSPSSKQESAFWLLYRLLKVSKKSTFFTDFKWFNWGEIVFFIICLSVNVRSLGESQIYSMPCVRSNWHLRC